ncbi:HAMP domain-containing protein [Patescibacteria group bacterium]|nr:HAMP domain-containing protein [Patescibacteria group bacterium]
MSVIIIMGTFATFTVFLYSKDVLFENEKKSLMTIVSEQAQQISILLKESIYLSQLIAEQDFLLDYLNDPKKTVQDIEVVKRLESYNLDDNYSAIYLMNKEGNTLVSTDETFVSNNYSFRDYFIEAQRGNHYTDISIGATSKELGYYFSAPVINKNKEIIGVLVLKMKPNVINGLIIKPYLESNKERFGLLAVIDGYSIIFHSNDPTKLFKSIADLSLETLKEINDNKRFSDFDIGSLNYNIKLEEIRSIEDSRSIEATSKELNNDLLLNIVKVENTSFYVVMIHNKNELISSALKISYTLAFFVFLSVIIAIISINILVTRFTKPLSELNEVVRKAITEEDLGQRALITSKDEIGVLSENFNELIEKLQKTLINVEEKVQKRTKQLEKTNRAMSGRELKMIELKKEIIDLKNKLKSK